MIGKEILNYRITAFIGKGGMGSVYLAEHKYITTQKVAIKVINKEMLNSFTVGLLKSEAEHLASLNHPNIVHFIDYHVDEEKTRIGYEIPFTREFYRYTPLKPSSEIFQVLKELEQKESEMMESLLH